MEIKYSATKDIDVSNILDATIQSYDLAALKYHAMFKDELKNKLFDRELLTEFAKNFQSDSQLYDMGCGPSGHIGKYLFDLGYNIVGLDISGKCVTSASQYNPAMIFKKMNMLDLDLEDNSIDGIISYYSIIHTPKLYAPEHFKEFRRVLKNGGKLLISVKEGDEEGYIDNFLECGTNIYFSYFSRDEIESFFNKNGFKILYLEERVPYAEEIEVKRIFGIGEKI